MKRTTRQWLEEEYPAALVMEEVYDQHILGAGVDFQGNQFVVYDYLGIIEVLMMYSGMTEEEAFEYFQYNQLGAYVGPSTPAFVEPTPIQGDYE